MTQERGSQAPAAPPTGLSRLVQNLEGEERFVEVVAALARGESATIDGAWGSACALCTAALARRCPSALVVVLPRVGDVESFAADVTAFHESRPLVFPAWESLPEEQESADPLFAERLRTLASLDADGSSGLLVCSIAALMQPVPSRSHRQAARRRFAVGDELDPESLLEWFVQRGLEHTTAVALAGEFSRRGGIVDVFAPDAEDPVRLEFFGDEIASIRRFDAETQRQHEVVDAVEICLVQPAAAFSDGELLVESLPEGAWVVLVELPELQREGHDYLERLARPDAVAKVETVIASLTEFPSVTLSALAAASMETTCHLSIESIERFGGARVRALEELRQSLGDDDRVLVACHNEAERGRLSELLTQSLDGEEGVEGVEGDGSRFSDRVSLCLGRLSQGFRLVNDRLVVLSDHELFNRTEVRPATKRSRGESRPLDSFLDLEPGDLVVHLSHGIARYRGLKLVEKVERAEEHLLLEFRDRVQVYVPVSLVHLVQKYVGPSKTAPELSRIGTQTWSKKKARVARAVSDLASDMLRLQAARESQEGLCHPGSTHEQREFEAAFPYTETPDQVESIREVGDDLEREQPMDRLLCGDVGYGKTEVAMRAAFKVIDGGRQVAVLVPTTVLAEQHLRTFRERMVEFPISIEALSRFKTRREQRDVLAQLAAGTLDVVIGTHRLVQADVEFANLGLLVIDEEQRFGVEAKEQLKRLRLEVDVLTMTATPIPRTLHMSLLGIRDISNLQTPPRDRMSIVTRIARDDGELIRQAIVRELNRNGQVFFVHNRVHSIYQVAQRLQEIVPEARLGIVHGQMKESELEEAMLEFVAGRTDVLVATTIIESGLDIPNANTIFIHEADRYGLADLHQLRGRVGRYKRRAYCYLLLPEQRPLSGVATRRLKAIEEFSELGAGFKIAMRDLEIRGAGNILGTQQSGHIASVGYELYCRLLENAVRRLQQLPVRDDRHVSLDLPVSAFLPNSYVPPGRHKVDVYRRLAEVSDHEQLEEFREELRDRFGPPPQEADRLLRCKDLALYALHWNLSAVRPEPRRDGQGPFVVLEYSDADLLQKLIDGSSREIRVVDSSEACVVVDEEETSGEALLALLKSVLQPF